MTELNEILKISIKKIPVLRYYSEMYFQYLTTVDQSFYTGEGLRDIPFFVILHHFVPTLRRHKSSNLHKPKS